MTTQMTPAISRALAYAQGELDAMSEKLSDSLAKRMEEGRAILSASVEKMRNDDTSEEGIIETMLEASRISRKALSILLLLQDTMS